MNAPAPQLLGSAFGALDWSVVAAYFLLTTLLGAKLAGRQANLRDFFLGGRRLPWYAVAGAMLTGHAAALELVESPPEQASVVEADEVSNLAVTEWSNQHASLDALTAMQISEAMAREDAHAAEAVAREAEVMARVIDAAAEALRAGGRIVYLGAGTSGRLGVLDAAECPPTFGVAPDRVVALIAGGDAAMLHSVEGAEDDDAQAARDLDAIQPPLSDADLVVGVSASGGAPYVLGGLVHARARGALTALICCNPSIDEGADIVVSLDTGPEVLPGSTRLKAGSATKMALNQLSTGAMALAGYVYDGHMVGVRPVNRKLRGRCVRIIAEMTSKASTEAEQLLDAAQGSIPVAVIMDRDQVTLDDARARLEAAGGRLRRALERD